MWQMILSPLIFMAVSRMRLDYSEAAAGHFDKIEERIRKSVTDFPETLKAEKARLTAELQKLSLAVRNTFKIQAELDASSEAIRAVAKELEDLSRKKKNVESDLETLKAKEFQQSDVDDAILDLKAHIQAFQRGWAKASAIMKKTLLKEVIHSILVSHKGLKIQFRLKHNLNKNFMAENSSASPDNKDNVIDLSKHRPLPPEGRVAESDFHNLGIGTLQVEVNGRGEANVFEPTQFCIKRIYRVQWKKAPINPDELAKLYWEEGLTMAQVAKALGVGRTTVRDNLCRLKALRGK
jgi:hypothetical protein